MSSGQREGMGGVVLAVSQRGGGCWGDVGQLVGDKTEVVRRVHMSVFVLETHKRGVTAGRLPVAQCGPAAPISTRVCLTGPHAATSRAARTCCMDVGRTRLCLW